MSVNLKKPLNTINTEALANSNSKSDGAKEKEIEDIDLTDMIVIEQHNLERLDIIFKVSLLDLKIDLLRYQYYWNVLHFTSEAQYLNGRNEIQLRIKIEELLIGVNEIIIKITNPKTKKEFFKTFQYQKGLPPFCGNCQVNPKKGYSLATKFTFTFENWKSNSMPLLYKIKYENKNGIFVD